MGILAPMEFIAAFLQSEFVGSCCLACKPLGRSEQTLLSYSGWHLTGQHTSLGTFGLVAAASEQHCSSKIAHELLALRTRTLHGTWCVKSRCGGSGGTGALGWLEPWPAAAPRPPAPQHRHRSSWPPHSTARTALAASKCPPSSPVARSVLGGVHLGLRLTSALQGVSTS